MEGLLQYRNTGNSFTFSKPMHWKLVDNILSSEGTGQDQQIFFVVDIKNIALHKNKQNQFALKYLYQTHQSIIEFIAPSPELAKQWVDCIEKTKKEILSGENIKKEEANTSSISNSKFKIQLDSQTQKVLLLPK